MVPDRLHSSMQQPPAPAMLRLACPEMGWVKVIMSLGFAAQTAASQWDGIQQSRRFQGIWMDTLGRPTIVLEDGRAALVTMPPHGPQPPPPPQDYWEAFYSAAGGGPSPYDHAEQQLQGMTAIQPPLPMDAASDCLHHPLGPQVGVPHAAQAVANAGQATRAAPSGQAAAAPPSAGLPTATVDSGHVMQVSGSHPASFARLSQRKFNFDLSLHACLHEVRWSRHYRNQHFACLPPPHVKSLGPGADANGLYKFRQPHRQGQQSGRRCPGSL